jgi:hypothetical protein
MVASLVAPAAVFLWQIWFATHQPSFTQSVRLAEQSLHFSQSKAELAWQVVWRSATLMEYAGLFLAGLAPGLLMLMYRTQREPFAPRAGQYYRWTAVGVWSGGLVAVHVVSMILAEGPLADRFKAGLLPTIPWVIRTVLQPDRIRYQLLLALIAVTSAAIVGAALIRVPALKPFWQSREPAGCFLIGTAFAFAALHLAYVQFQDTYIIIFLPFFLLGLARFSGAERAPAQSIRTMAATSILFGIAFAFWLRGDLNRQETLWRAADEIHAVYGAEPLKVGGNLTWLAYHGAFDAWVTHLGSSARPEDYAGRLYLFFYWLAEKRARAEYVLYTCEDEHPQASLYETIGRVPYRDGLLRERFVYIVKRNTGT